MASGTPWPRFVGNYQLGELLGSGVSGSTFRAVHVHTGMEVALKLQPTTISYATNDLERIVYPLIQGGVGMPKLWAHGTINGWDYLAMDLLGLSLQTMFRKSGSPTMDMRSVLSIAVQLISRLEFMHSRGVLHRDIQLGNSVLGMPPNNTILYMIDFGFSEKYITSQGKHVRNRQQLDFVGNYWFSSVNVHCRGKTTSRRDDIESLALVLIHILTANGLPWTRNGVPRDDTEHDRLKRMKRDLRPEELCEGLPEEFAAFLHYCRGLQFAAQPDYARWRERFLELGEDLGYGNVEPFIWPPPPVTNNPTVQVKRSQAPKTDKEIENILRGLAQLQVQDLPNNLAKEPVPTSDASQPTVAATSAATQAAAGSSTQARLILGQKDLNAVPSPAGPAVAKKTSEVIVISDSPAETAPTGRQSKAAKLQLLAHRCGTAVDNKQLSGLVRQFRMVLAEGTSRVLTREGFTFLDALRKQLADPSIFIVPLRTSQRRSARTPVPAREEVTNEERRSRLSQLRMAVPLVFSNRQLASLIAEFGTLIDKSKNKNFTKDAFAFLEGVEERLSVLSGGEA